MTFLAEPGVRPLPSRVAEEESSAASRGAGGSSFRDLIGRAWHHRFRLVIFATNGMNVFAIGLLLQVLLVKYANMGHVPSYVLQTFVSVQLSFLLSRFLTWGDRYVALLPALARFNVQQLAVTGLGMAGYAGLELSGMNYIVANVVVTAILTPVSFLASHKWSLARKTRSTGAFGIEARTA